MYKRTFLTIKHIIMKNCLCNLFPKSRQNFYFKKAKFQLFISNIWLFSSKFWLILVIMTYLKYQLPISLFLLFITIFGFFISKFDLSYLEIVTLSPIFRLYLKPQSLISKPGLSIFIIFTFSQKSNGRSEHFNFFSLNFDLIILKFCV